MNTRKIYFGTLTFVWMKLALGAATCLISVLLLAICTGLGLLMRNATAFMIFMGLWLLGTAVAYNVIMYYFGYLVKAGHVAIVAETMKTGQLPAQQFETARQMVQQRFVTGNVYFVVDRLVSGAVKQLQNGLQKIDNLFGGIPGIGAVVAFAKVFVGIALGYVDECCLGYTFYMEDQDVFKSAADGVVIYFQNWKKLLKNAAVMSLAVIGVVFVSWLVIFLFFGGIFAALRWNGVVAMLLSLFAAMAFKSAFVDSYMMISMMVSYMEVAPETQITFDLYEKLCRLSRKFKELFERGSAQGVQVS